LNFLLIFIPLSVSSIQYKYPSRITDRFCTRSGYSTLSSSVIPWFLSVSLLNEMMHKRQSFSEQPQSRSLPSFPSPRWVLFWASKDWHPDGIVASCFRNRWYVVAFWPDLSGSSERHFGEAVFSLLNPACWLKLFRVTRECWTTSETESSIRWRGE
jgi:hypothetical protein